MSPWTLAVQQIQAAPPAVVREATGHRVAGEHSCTRCRACQMKRKRERVMAVLSDTPTSIRKLSKAAGCNHTDATIIVKLLLKAGLCALTARTTAGMNQPTNLYTRT